MNIIRTKDPKICIQLRDAVFVREQGISPDIELDSYDNPGSGAFHFLLIVRGIPIGTFRCFPEDPATLRFGRFCILKKKRGKHYGKLAMAYAEGFARGRGMSQIVIHAQCRAAGFYESCGYGSISDVFYEDGVPHRVMKKVLS